MKSAHVNRICSLAMVRLAMLVVVVLCYSCGGDRSAAKPKSNPPLLGQNSKQTIDMFAASCPTRISWSGADAVLCISNAQTLELYRLAFNDEGLVEAIGLSMFPDDAALLRTFDRAIAPIVDPRMVSTLRASITAPSGEAMHLPGSNFLMSSWQTLTRPDGTTGKIVVWSYSPPRQRVAE